MNRPPVLKTNRLNTRGIFPVQGSETDWLPYLPYVDERGNKRFRPVEGSVIKGNGAAAVWLEPSISTGVNTPVTSI